MFRVVRKGGGADEITVPRTGVGYTHEIDEVNRCLHLGLTESPLMPLDDTLDMMRLLDGVRAQIGLRYPFE